MEYTVISYMGISLTHNICPSLSDSFTAGMKDV